MSVFMTTHAKPHTSAFNVKNLDSSGEFYSKVLGLEVVETASSNGAMAKLSFKHSQNTLTVELIGSKGNKQVAVGDVSITTDCIRVIHTTIKSPFIKALKNHQFLCRLLLVSVLRCRMP
jgi:catechol-2,3-dioxygenase